MCRPLLRWWGDNGIWGGEWGGRLDPLKRGEAAGRLGMCCLGKAATQCETRAECQFTHGGTEPQTGTGLDLNNWFYASLLELLDEQPLNPHS